jgi:hypothetical protein
VHQSLSSTCIIVIADDKTTKPQLCLVSNEMCGDGHRDVLAVVGVFHLLLPVVACT